MTQIDPSAGIQPSAPSPERRKEIRAAAEQFEGLLLQQLIRRLREAQLSEGFFGSGAGSSVYEGLFETHLSEAMAGGSPFGIADQLERLWLDGASNEGVLDEIARSKAIESYAGAQVPLGTGR